MVKKIPQILLVEDDSAIVDIYKTIMEKSGFSVNLAGSGQEAIKIIKMVDLENGKRPDIVLLDLILPDVNGIDVLREIRMGNKTKDIIVFILTNQEKEQVQFLDDIKPDKFIIKANITPTQLVELIKEQLKLKGHY